jgi:transposase
MDRPTGTFVGIDVSKGHLDVAVRPSGEAFRVPNTPAGLAELAERLRPAAPALAVLEATGGYELPALAALRAAGIPAAVVDPRRARAFAEATARRAKTDRIDAAALAHLAEAARPEPAPPPDPAREALAALLARRDQLVEMRTMEGNRLKSCPDARVRGAIERHLEWLGAELARAEAELDEAVRSSPEWRERDELLRSIPGVGPGVSRAPLAGLPELGTTSGARLASLAGLAPYARDSGARRGARRIRGGRAEVRRLLYMAARGACRCRGGPLKEFAERLRARGKAPKVALIALARRILEIANAVVRTGRGWQPELAMPR